MKEIWQLSRWKEHLPYTIPLTALGAIIAARNGVFLDQKLIFVVLGNIATVCYAFMINDIEDAEDDARDPYKAKRNPVSAGRISHYKARTATRILAAFALLMYTLTNTLTLGIGIIILALSHTYSWKKVRLKAYPVADVVSHSLMLSGLLLISGFTAYSTTFKHIWPLTAAATLFSVYGQLYNQLRDYEVDYKAKLKNTTILVGKKKAQYLKNATILLAVVALLTAIYFKTFPVWLLLPIAITAPLSLSLKTKTDSSGVIAIDLSGRLQTQLLLIFNIVVLSWLGQIFVSSF